MEHLEQFQRPSRYIGGEINAVHKDESGLRLRMALAFPDVYDIGMSHLGLKILYGLINEQPEFWAERVMAPWLDREDELRRTGEPLRSLESGRPLREFDVVGFSLQYELSYTNVLNMLELGGIPLMARDRGADDPLVIGGGPGACNPEPVADFFDLFYLGDAEAGLIDLLQDVADWRRTGADKEDLLRRLALRPGVYVPSFFQPVYDSDGRLREIRPLQPGYEHVERAVVPDLAAAYFPDRQVVPFTKLIHDRLALEISRGCSRGCRFCQAGFIYRPVRERSPEAILDIAARALSATGLDEASFLSLSAGDYTCLLPLMRAFMDAHAPRHIALSLPSLRVKSLTPDMMQQIKRVRKTGFTLAPEAGTQRLRDVINKDLTEDDLMFAGREAFKAGWRLIKLYFMVGLPTETEADVAAIADLARRVKSGTRSKVNVSFATFVPKAHTPFQWDAMLDLDQMYARMDFLRGLLRQTSGLKPKWNEAELSLLEGVLSRGDRRLGAVLRTVHARGARFDAWSDQCRLDRWMDALAEHGLTVGEYLRVRSRDEMLPWSHLHAGPDAAYLWRERERAYQGGKTADCRDGDCGGCGVCDFEAVQPVLSRAAPDRPSVAPAVPEDVRAARLRIRYAKTGVARLLSHLETVDVFLRAFRRAGLAFKMSQGFHPQPKMQFATPLPVGLPSLDEYLDVHLIDPPSPDSLNQSLQTRLPAGFEIHEVRSVQDGEPKLSARGGRFAVQSPEPVFDVCATARLEAEGGLWLTKTGKKGPRRVDIKPLVGDIKVLTPKTVEIILLHGPAGSVRPSQALEVLFDLQPEQAHSLEVVKLETML